MTYFTGLVDKLVGMIIPILVSKSPNGCCYGNQLNLEDGRRHPQERPSLLASAFENGLADRRFAFERLNGNIQATLCTNLVNLSLMFSEFMLLKCTIFAAICPQFDNDLFLSPWHSETDRRSQF